MTTAFSDKTWNIFWSQIAFYVAVGVLLAFALSAWRLRRKMESALFSTAAIILMLAQVVVLGLYDAMVRSWDDTEFKEMFIALGLGLFAFQAARQLLSGVRPAREVRTAPEAVR